MHAGIGAILGIIAGGALGFFVIDTVSEGIPGQEQFETAAIAASNRAVAFEQPAPVIQRVVAQGEGPPVPCYGWRPTDDAIAAIGMSVSEGDAVRRAYAQSSTRIWAAFAEPCRQSLGVESMDVIDRMGLAPCLELIRGRGDAATVGALIEALTVEFSFLTRDLAEGVGAAEAERLVTSGRVCLDTNLLRRGS